MLPVPLADSRDVQMLLEDLNVPIAQISPRELNPNFIQVFADDESASYSITSLVLEQGHTRVGFIKGIDSHGATGLRLAGFQRACREHGVTIDGELIVSGHFDFESGRLAARHLFDQAEPPRRSSPAMMIWLLVSYLRQENATSVCPRTSQLWVRRYSAGAENLATLDHRASADSSDGEVGG